MEMGTILLTTTKASEGALSFSTKPTENTIKSKKKKKKFCTIVDVCRRSKTIGAFISLLHLQTVKKIGAESQAAESSALSQ